MSRRTSYPRQAQLAKYPRQAYLAKYPRQAYLAKLVVPAAAPCMSCDHPRSSHSMLVLSGLCKVPGCHCFVFEPQCGCGHPLCEHTWGTPPNPWACSLCRCLQFGARTAEQLGLF
jgi:hypothetical protein